MSYKVAGIANEFLDRASAAGRAITAMHLQKFCYMAHGFDLALFNRPLTVEKPEAWDYGPVYPTLYDSLKKFGSGAVTAPICVNNWAKEDRVRGDVVRASLSNEETQLIDTIWKDYGNFEAFQLSALTHEDNSPWAKIYKPGIKHLVIPDSLIKDYFVGLTSGAVAAE